MTAEIKKIIKKINRLTDINYHTESVLTLAKFMKNKDAINKLSIIQSIHDNCGFIEHKYITKRHDILNELLDSVEVKYGNDIRKLIYSAF